MLNIIKDEIIKKLMFQSSYKLENTQKNLYKTNGIASEDDLLLLFSFGFG